MDQGLLAEFLAECGLDAPYQVEVVVPGEPTPRVVEYRQPFLVIGQREDSDLRLDHWLVGRRHVYLQSIEGRFRCVDLGARTGTHGGVATERAGWVDPEVPLKIGPYLVRPLVPINEDHPYLPLPIVTWSTSDAAAPSRDSARDAAPHWAMNQALALVGRSPFCQVRLSDPAVSRCHCGLVLTPRGVWVVDLLSQKPVLVNGASVRFARVRPGDELQVGPYHLTPHYDMSLIHAARDRTDRPPITPPVGPMISSFPGESRAGSSPPLDASPTELLPTLFEPTDLWDPTAGTALQTTSFVAPELVVSTLVQQFGLMQQQMFDQFHQMMMAMFERFADLHRETSATIRDEFDEVRKLSGEIETLRTETARLAEVSSLAMQRDALDHSARHQPTATPATPPAPRPMPPLNRPGSVPPAGPIPQPAPAAAANRSGIPGATRPAMPPIPTPADPPADIHAQLCSRLNQMETERQGRWQKILAMMSTTRD